MLEQGVRIAAVGPTLPGEGLWWWWRCGLVAVEQGTRIAAMVGPALPGAVVVVVVVVVMRFGFGGAGHAHRSDGKVCGVRRVAVVVVAVRVGGGGAGRIAVGGPTLPGAVAVWL